MTCCIGRRSITSAPSAIDVAAELHEIGRLTQFGMLFFDLDAGADLLRAVREVVPGQGRNIGVAVAYTYTQACAPAATASPAARSGPLRPGG